MLVEFLQHVCSVACYVKFDVAYVAGHKTGATMSFGHYARHDVKRLKQTVDTIAAQIEWEWL